MDRNSHWTEGIDLQHFIQNSSRTCSRGGAALLHPSNCPRYTKFINIPDSIRYTVPRKLMNVDLYNMGSFSPLLNPNNWSHFKRKPVSSIPTVFQWRASALENLALFPIISTILSSKTKTQTSFNLTSQTNTIPTQTQTWRPACPSSPHLRKLWCDDFRRLLTKPKVAIFPSGFKRDFFNLLFGNSKWGMIWMIDYPPPRKF